MKTLKKMTNGVALIIIGCLHTNLFFSPDGFGIQFKKFAEQNFYNISRGMDELPAQIGVTNFEHAAAFWFFYFGILIIPIGLLVHAMEKNKGTLPYAFTISYLAIIAIGCYMIPKSGMTFIMMPHAIFMLGNNWYKKRKIALQNH